MPAVADALKRAMMSALVWPVVVQLKTDHAENARPPKMAVPMSILCIRMSCMALT